MAFLGRILNALGWTWLGNLLLAMAGDEAQAKVADQKRQGASDQAARTSADTSAAQERIGQAEAQTDRSQAGVVDAARKGEF